MNEPKKSLGQNWLIDQPSLERIVDLIQISPQDQIVEIGPGQGNLTKLLTQKAEQVIGIEIDQDLILNLRKKQLKNLTLIHEDILKFNFGKIPGKYKLVGNIPYYLTSHLIKVISSLDPKPERVVLLVQKEVAARLSALPGQLSVLGLTAQYFWEVSLDIEVSKDKFYPIPKVDSQVVILKPKLSLPLQDEKQFFNLIKIGFSSKRKKLINNLEHGLRLNRPLLVNIFKELKINSNLRAQQLDQETWLRLFSSISYSKL